LKTKYPDDLKIETNTPVTNIEDHKRKAPNGLRYTLTTPRGTIRARHVVHCTNAHVAHLVPGLKGRICPVRGQMSAQHPGTKFRSQGAEHSWLFNYDRGFDYLTQLPPSPSDAGEMMMFGGGFSQGEGGGISDLGVSTDSELSLYADIHLSGALSAVFGRENWGAVPVRAVEQMWTGNMGFSADGFPWVGRLPASLTRRGQDAQEERGTEWVSAAFSGEGMVLAWLCGKGLGTMLLCHDNDLLDGEAVDLSWFPEQMLVTEERAKKAVYAFSVSNICN
jgi:glycine/D-amino acid oxidase-like deaminating enzyme